MLSTTHMLTSVKLLPWKELSWKGLERSFFWQKEGQWGERRPMRRAVACITTVFFRLLLFSSCRKAFASFLNDPRDLVQSHPLSWRFSSTLTTTGKVPRLWFTWEKSFLQELKRKYSENKLAPDASFVHWEFTANSISAWYPRLVPK